MITNKEVLIYFQGFLKHLVICDSEKQNYVPIESGDLYFVFSFSKLRPVRLQIDAEDEESYN